MQLNFSLLLVCVKSSSSFTLLMAVSWHFVKLHIGQNVGQSPDFREGFDVAVARAVAELRILGLFSVYYLTSYQLIYSNMRLLFSRVVFEHPTLFFFKF